MLKVTSSFCISNHPMIYQVCDVIMSMSTWDRVHFWIYLLNHKSLSHQTWPIDIYKEGQHFSGIFQKIRWARAKFQFHFNLVTCTDYSIINYIMILVFHIFEKVNKGDLKMVNVNYNKWPELSLLPYKGLELVSSL